MTRDEIIDKIRKVEALFLGTDSPGEMQAALGALDRLKSQRLLHDYLNDATRDIAWTRF